ncbi:MAG: fibronectin type III domain-containing protein [Betaproteobacteria bacterium]|nr:fibronectin type III domain-containing protein [Betaproteobacteria bacterium]
MGNAGVPVAPALNASSAVPVTVSVGEATGIAAGRAHTCTIASGTGAVHCWGANAGGQLGDNSTTDRPTPVQVSGLTGVLALAAGGDRTCALMTGGAVKCWGLNTSGELGTGPGPANQTTPAEIPGLTGVSAITAGDQHVCALATGAVKCWGVNGNGQLGNDSTAQSNIPLDVPGVSGATVVSAGGAHTCALIGGAAKCWGRNANGQLGDGSTEQRLTPVDVVGLASGVAGLSAGKTHSCARLSSGVGRCWGTNGSGEVGDNSITERWTPVEVLGGAPDAPTNVSATAIDASATVTFSSPAYVGGGPVTGYTVASNPAGGVDSNAGSTSTTHVITGLTNGIAYTFTVTAANEAGTGPASAASAAVTPATVPGAPTAVTATRGNGQVTVGFAARPAAAVRSRSTATSIRATSPGAAPCTSITVGPDQRHGVHVHGDGDQCGRHRPASAASAAVTPATGRGRRPAGAGLAPASDGGSAITSYTATSNPGNFTGSCTAPCASITVSGLTNGTAYTFTVTATNAAGTGPASAASAAVTPATVPGAPTAVTAAPGNAQATVGFTAPVSDGGSAITSYTATSSPGNFTGSCTAPCASITVSGLANGTAYTFTVTATNAVGTGPASAASAAVTPATVPGAPTAVTATRGNGQVTVGFTAPASDGGSAITSYTATSDPGNFTGSCTAPCASITVSGLTNGTAYTFTVTATNAVGTGPASAASAAVTPATVPGAPTAVTATRGNGQVTVGFAAPASDGGSAITQYTATSSPGNFTGNCTAPCASITVSGLANGTAYTFTVTATNAVGTGPASAASAAVTPATVPGAPTAVTATRGNGQVTVGFAAPASDGGSAITQYTATSNPGNFTGNCTAPCASITVSGLANGTAYTFTVTATNAVGTGPASAASAAVTPATVPGAPTAVTATRGNGQVTVGFAAPASDGGSAITQYTATSNPGNFTGSCTAPCASITVMGLANGTAYTYTVTATNAIGTGPASAASAAVTPATVPGRRRR